MRPSGAARRLLILGSTAVLAIAAPAACGSGDTGRATTERPPSGLSDPGSSPTTPSAARASTPVRVRPPAGHPLATIDRDAGITVELRDGSLLWLFGDTAARRDDGTVEYFVIGTAAWAAADDRTTTQVAVDATPAPLPFVVPSDGDAGCPRPGLRAGTWPASAIVVPVGERDRVLVWLHRLCLGDDGTLVDRGMALAEWWYDPATPPGDSPVAGRLVAEHLFDHRSFGTAAVLGDDGYVYAYRCDTPADPTRVESFGPCAVARVALRDVADPDAYDVIDDDLDLPGGEPAPVPPGGFGVSFDPTLGAYVMAYSPWPGASEVLAVRTAEEPAGPWSPPVTVSLPDCDDRIGERALACYAAGPQPAFSTATGIGVGWYDRAVETFPTRGAYVVATVPVSALRR